jgi:hypothetical protein
MKVKNLIIVVALMMVTPALHAASPAGTALVISDVSAVHTNGRQIELTARVYSRNPAVKIKKVEYFLDSTNHVIYGRGILMDPVGGMLNSTNGIAHTRLSLIFGKGQFRDVFIHACGSDLQWTTFTKTSVGDVTVDEILDKIQRNYGQPSKK